MNKAIIHRNMRILLVLIVSIFCFTFSWGFKNNEQTFADYSYTPQVTVQSKTVHRGQTFSLDIELSNNEGLISLLLALDYDSSVMTLKNVIQKDALGSLNFTTTNVDTEEGYGILPFKMLWDGRTSDATNGTLVSLIFDTYIDAPVGEYPVTLTFDRKNTNVAYQTPVDISITNSVITLITGEFRAVYRNYDGKILFDKDYNSDDIPSYPETLPKPQRNADAEYIYTFVGWEGAPSDDLNTLIFEATYKLTPQEYTIFYYIDGINGYPDGVIDETEDFYTVKSVPYGTYIENLEAPVKQYYQFYGWYGDVNFTRAPSYVKMPSHNIRVYGYYSFDVRDKDIPIISLESVDIDGEDVVVTATLLKNTGFNGLVLTLNYDRDALIFEGFERADILYTMQFDTTNTEDLSIENFRFYFESAENSNETGDFLKLYFKLKEGIENATYNVWFDYDYHTDATYVTEDKEIKYTMIEFYNGEVPVGERYHWEQHIGSDRAIDITSEDGKPVNVYLEVDLVTENVSIDENLIQVSVGENMYLSSAYEIKLVQNKKEINPNTVLTIRIKLTENEKKGNIKFYYLNDDYELINYDFRIEDGELVFTTNHLSNWVIFNDYVEQEGEDNKPETPNVIFGSKGNAVILIGLPIVLAVATMLYALRLRQIITKIKKEAHND